MVAGIPGTTIGGLYYILLAFLMPVKEAYLSWNGQSSFKRWMHVTLQVINAAGIMASIYATGMLLGYLVRHSRLTGVQLPQQLSTLMSLTSACLALGILAVVIVVVMVLSMVMPKRPSRMTIRPGI